MKNVIVTGSNGFIGKWLVKELTKENIQVLAIDIGINDYYINYPTVKYLDFQYNDFNKLSKEIKKGSYDVVYHLAWKGTSGKQRENEFLQIQNAYLVKEILKFAKDIECKKFVFVGSINEDEIYKTINTHGNKPDISSFYGTGKLLAHFISKIYAAKFGIDFVCAKITNAYGEGEVSPRLINTTIKKMINGEQLFFTSAMQNYDFIHVEDVAKALFLIGEKGISFGEYIIGSSYAKPLRNYIEELVSIINPNYELRFGDIPFSGPNLPIDFFDTINTENDTGFKATISFQEGIERTYEWIKKNEQR